MTDGLEIRPTKNPRRIDEVSTTKPLTHTFDPPEETLAWQPESLFWPPQS